MYFDNIGLKSPPKNQWQSREIAAGGMVGCPVQDMYNLTSVPQAGLLGLTKQVLSACVVGGGSTINRMMLPRGAAGDYDNWGKLNDEPGWGFEGLIRYFKFKKSAMFQEPLLYLVCDYNITWDLSVYGDNSPTRASISSFQYPGLFKSGTEKFILVSQIDGGSGKAYGIIWYPNALGNRAITRSYAVTGYYDPVADRTDLHILTCYWLNEVLFDAKLKANGVRI
ncbi:hypothetical protein BKA67DRAFT_536060 [Truncatella angustata]|uniref:Glucose-methanol-choline oxidoreductase N-terminal domain-containing protein n=1 Tax=Truncatella angustata TaxID=152316 RepID=A0A9P8UME6_9PEZI|nr:uncharacterized protein BKA67DRAFT_536060 [Truncatella angustata]KAH6654759.1 hypothetical protein BKA67DRAFT_536060 [Truncatella angustata]